MRSILVDWLTKLIDKFRLKSETLFLAVHILDLYLSQVEVEITKL